MGERKRRPSEESAGQAARASKARPRAGRLIVVLLLILLPGGWWWFVRDAGNTQHFILLIIDTARWDSFGCYGAERPTTPNIDAVAANGVRFDQAIATSCWTLPAIGSILTSTYPATHGGFGKRLQLKRIRPEVTTGAEVLRDAGFRTQAFANCAFLSPELGLNRGFEKYNYVEAFNFWIRRADETVAESLNFIPPK